MSGLRLDGSTCWLVVAQTGETELRRLVLEEWSSEFPYALGPPPWTVSAVGAHAVVVGRSPGSEGSADHLAEVCSRRLRAEPVHALWLDPDREQVRTWVGGELVESGAGDPRAVARAFGIELSEPLGPSVPRSVAVVSGASLAGVRAALGPVLDEGWLRIESCTAGVLVSGGPGELGTQAWDLAESLPEATVYYLQQGGRPDTFSVLVLRGSQTVGRFEEPPLADEADLRAGIAGARTPDSILARLGVPPHLLGRDGHDGA